MSEFICDFCKRPVDPAGARTWTKVSVWVFGPKRNGACMQGSEALGFAHDECARLARRGIHVEQGSLW
jgi:hypothetical protein